MELTNFHRHIYIYTPTILLVHGTRHSLAYVPNIQIKSMFHHPCVIIIA